MGFRALSLLGREAARIVLPSPCIVCGAELPWRDREASCCRPCWGSLPRIEGPKCRGCAMPWSGEVEADLCLDCRAEPTELDWCEAWGHYRGSLEVLLAAFKFERHHFLDRHLARLLEQLLNERGDTSFDAIVPVPMHAAKLRRRGYNQAKLLARPLSRWLGLSMRTDLLAKIADREPQSTLARRDRAANVRGAFQASPSAGELSLLLVDDITTTGETLRACARALRQAGAARVCAVTVAKA